MLLLGMADNQIHFKLGKREISSCILAGREIAALDPQKAVSCVATLDELLAVQLARSHFNAILLSWFGGLAILLAAVNIFGVMAYVVAQRTSEFGLHGLRIAVARCPGAHARARNEADSAGRIIRIDRRSEYDLLVGEFALRSKCHRPS
jgi:hypothetical protein